MMEPVALPQYLQNGRSVGPASTSARSAPFSVHSRGVHMGELGRRLDCGYSAVSLYSCVRDVSGALRTFLLLQGWLSVWVAGLTIVSVSFFTYYHEGRAAGPVDLTPLSFLVFLPLVVLLYSTFVRREQALAHLALAKSLLFQLGCTFHTRCSEAASAAALKAMLHALTEAMRAYFLPPRFYSQDYPLLGVKNKMLQIAKESSRQKRRIYAVFKGLARATEELGLSESVADKANEHLIQLHVEFEHLANIKEYRTPQGIRVLARLYVAVVIPIFFGPVYAHLRNIHFVFALFLAVVTNLAAATLLQTAMALEDPFDNQGLDGVYVEEAFHEALLAIGLDESATSLDTGEHDHVRLPGRMGTKLGPEDTIEEGDEEV